MNRPDSNRKSVRFPSQIEKTKHGQFRNFIKQKPFFPKQFPSQSQILCAFSLSHIPIPFILGFSSLSLSLKIPISLDSTNGDESDGRSDNEDVQRGTEGGG